MTIIKNINGDNIEDIDAQIISNPDLYLDELNLNENEKMYELDTKKQWLKPAQYKEVSIENHEGDEPSVRMLLVQRKHCFYDIATSIQEAEKQMKNKMIAMSQKVGRRERRQAKRNLRK